MGEFAATAELRQYRLTGKLNAKLLLFNENIPFDMRFTVDEKDNVRGWVKFDILYVLGLPRAITVPLPSCILKTMRFILNGQGRPKADMEGLAVFYGL